MKFQLKNITADPGEKMTFFTECGKEIIVNTRIKPGYEGKKKVVYEVVSVEGFPDCKYIAWTLKELTIE